ncbi:MAG: hypothetical protein KDC95_09815 [Planctomycetes bacterium]|nr:hypothetical protein [Planctomycetota bacterium]
MKLPDIQDWIQKLERGGEDAAPYAASAMRRTMFRYRKMFAEGQTSAQPIKFRGRGGFYLPGAGNARGKVNAFFLLGYPIRKTDDKKATWANTRFEVFTRSKIAAAHEFGAKIAPKAGKRYLAIRTGYALQSDGRARRYWSSPAMLRKHFNFPIRVVPARGGRPALLLVDVANVDKKKGSKKYLAERAKADRRPRWRVAFKLIPRTRLKARLGFYRGFERLAPNLLAERLGKEYERFLREVYGKKTRRRAA